ncbi:MAG: hypothetical protein AAB074_21240 [Planctomycetota bacterium]
MRKRMIAIAVSLSSVSCRFRLRVKAPWVVITGGDEPFDSLRSLTVDWRRGWCS